MTSGAPSLPKGEALTSHNPAIRNQKNPINDETQQDVETTSSGGRGNNKRRWPVLEPRISYLASAAGAPLPAGTTMQGIAVSLCPD